MKVLIVAVTMPYPPASGGEIRIHGIAEGLAQAGHAVTIISFHAGAAPNTHPNVRLVTVPPFTRSRIARLKQLLFSREPDIATRFYSELFANKLRSLLSETTFDIIHIEGIESAPYLPVVKTLRPKSRIVFDTFNAEYMLQRRIFDIDRTFPARWPAAAYSFLQIGRIKRFEQRMCQEADAVIAVSEEDAAILRNFRSDRMVHVVSNGIWIDRYQNAENKLNLGRCAIVFTGKMDYRPNVDAVLWFCDAILPKIQSEVSNAEFFIVGQKPHARLAPLCNAPGVTITGWVESIAPYLHAATVYAAPLRMGSGTRLKLLEAMATSNAIIATSTACAGLSQEARSALIIADDVDDFADKVVNLLSDADSRRDLGERARIQVAQRYDWATIIPELLSVYSQLGSGSA